MSENIKLICLFRNGIERQTFLACFVVNTNTFVYYSKTVDTSVGPILFSDVSAKQSYNFESYYNGFN